MAVTGETEISLVSNITKPKNVKVILLLENCILPPEKLFPTPSLLDGLNSNSETDLRILGCELIQTSGILLKLPQVAMATGQVIFQRFFYSKSFVRHGMEIVAMACITLASKIEESPRRIRDVINVFHHIKQVKYGKTISPLILDQNYINTKNQVIKAERRVLKELGFCVHVKHPHKIIVTLLQVLECERNTSLIQTAWNYMNDSLRSDVFVRYHPEAIACACIYLSARLLKISLPKQPPWFLVFGITEEDITEISLTILKLYSRKKVDPEKLEKEVDDLKKAHMEAKLKAKGISPNSSLNANNSGFSPNSQPSSPRKSPLQDNNKKENGSTNTVSPQQMREKNDNHFNSHKRNKSYSSSKHLSPSAQKQSGSSSGGGGSPSPKRKLKTPPRSYKDPIKSHSRSRSREMYRERVHKEPKHHRSNASSSHSHKRKRSRSRTRNENSSRSPSNRRHSNKKYYKDRERSRR